MLLSFVSEIPSARLIVVVGGRDKQLPSLPSTSQIKLISYQTLLSLCGGNRHPLTPPQAEDIATICYTSGTTGTPKQSQPHQEDMQSSDSSSGDEKLQVRKLQLSDKNKGFLELLEQLTVCDSVSDREFEERFQEISCYGDDHYICVIEDDRSGKIIATGTVFIEKKFIRNCGKVGHIEDVVVDSNARGRQLGKKIIEFLTEHARSTGCYKVILDCSIENKPFYEKCGYKQKEIQMVKYFN